MKQSGWLVRAGSDGGSGMQQEPDLQALPDHGKEMLSVSGAMKTPFSNC